MKSGKRLFEAIKTPRKNGFFYRRLYDVTVFSVGAKSSIFIDA
jgi:hypothetical protein